MTGKFLSKNNFVNFTPIYETAIPPSTSVKKCAPTTIQLKAITPANEIKKYFSFGKRNEATKATTNIVEVCPEGKEWNSEFKLKKLNSRPPSNDA